MTVYVMQNEHELFALYVMLCNTTIIKLFFYLNNIEILNEGTTTALRFLCGTMETFFLLPFLHEMT